MNRITLFFFLLLTVSGIAVAQKFAYVDSEYILANLPEYTQAKSQLDQVAQKWQKEIEDKNALPDKAFKAYEAETKRISAVQAGMTPEQIQDIVMGTIAAAMDTGDLIGGNTPIAREQMPEMAEPPMPEMAEPPMMEPQGEMR